MRYKWLVVLGTLMLGTLLVFWQSALAKPPEKPGNPALQACLSELAAKEAEIAALQAEIAELNNLVTQLQSQALVPQTGQTTCYDANFEIIGCAGTGQDGDLQKGIPWPVPRFTDHEDGTVTDNLTGLIWMKDASVIGAQTWANACAACNGLKDGEGGLTDGSQAGDWRLPNVRELEGLVDYGRYNPAFPEVHPFVGLVAGRYWSSTTYVMATPDAYLVHFYFGYAAHNSKSLEFYVWCVRGGK